MKSDLLREVLEKARSLIHYPEPDDERSTSYFDYQNAETNELRCVHCGQQMTAKQENGVWYYKCYCSGAKKESDIRYETNKFLNQYNHRTKLLKIDIQNAAFPTIKAMLREQCDSLIKEYEQKKEVLEGLENLND